jgi:hypothetical protein
MDNTEEPAAVSDGATLLRLDLPDRPGSLALVTSRLAWFGVDILRVEVVGRDGDLAVDDVLVCGGDLDAALASLEEEEVRVVTRRPHEDLPDPALAMADACASVTNARSLGEARRRLLEAAVQLVRADGAVLFRDAGHGWLRPVASTSGSLPAVRGHEASLARTAILLGRSVAETDSTGWAPAAYQGALGSGSVAVVPAGAPPFLALAAVRREQVAFASGEVARLEAFVRVALGTLAAHGERNAPPPSKPAVALHLAGTGT